MAQRLEKMRARSDGRRDAVYAAYAQSLFWIILLAVALELFAVPLRYLVVGLIQGNPHPVGAGVTANAILFSIILGAVTVVKAAIVFGPPSLFQAAITDLSARMRIREIAGVCLAFPFTALVAWYCYDYLVPSNHGLWNTLPYEHGLTVGRYRAILAIQGPSSLFGFLYWRARVRRRSRLLLIVGALTAILVAGAMWGRSMWSAL